MKKYLICLCFFCQTWMAQAQQDYAVQSPDGRILLTVRVDSVVAYSVSVGNRPVVAGSRIGMRLGNGQALGKSPVVVSKIERAIRETIVPPVAIKRKTIEDHCNELTLQCRGGYDLVFRAYDDGVAYQFRTHFTDTITVVDETAECRVGERAILYFPQVVPRDNVDRFHTSFEEPYQVKPLDSLAASALLFSPVLVDAGGGLRLVLTESGIDDYPGMFLARKGDGLAGVFAPYPLEEKMLPGDFPQAAVTKRAGFIARTKGERSFPWRLIVIGDDRVLPATDLVYRLAPPNRIGDCSWIKPGQGTDEWIINIALHDVDFKAGINTATYKYYIDFAAQFGLERIMLDAGWSDVKDLFKINPDLDMEEIAAYARTKGIGLSMWTLAATLDRQLEPALDQFQRWGVNFIMTDFMDRDDQVMVNFYARVAEACAQRQIMVMFHGAYKPAGFERTYPNAVTREGVLGSEYNAWSEKATPENNVLIAFIRMVSGPLDYEPGLLDNASKETFRPIWGKVMSQGTRCHQLAMFCVYDSPINIFAGNPSTGKKEPAFMELLGSVPTTWDETLVPDAQLGDYVVVARQHGKDWFVAGLNDGTPRDISIPLSFLPPGSFAFTLCADGLNADRTASDYRLTQGSLSSKGVLKVSMAAGGGFLIRLRG